MSKETFFRLREANQNEVRDTAHNWARETSNHLGPYLKEKAKNIRYRELLQEVTEMFHSSTSPEDLATNLATIIDDINLELSNLK